MDQEECVAMTAGCVIICAVVESRKTTPLNAHQRPNGLSLILNRLFGQNQPHGRTGLNLSSLI